MNSNHFSALRLPPSRMISLILKIVLEECWNFFCGVYFIGTEWHWWCQGELTWATLEGPDGKRSNRNIRYHTKSATSTSQRISLPSQLFSLLFYGAQPAALTSSSWQLKHPFTIHSISRTLTLMTCYLFFICVLYSIAACIISVKCSKWHCEALQPPMLACIFQIVWMYSCCIGCSGPGKCWNSSRHSFQ